MNAGITRYGCRPVRGFEIVTGRLFLSAALVFFSSTAFAATYFSRQTGDWNVNTTWSTAACGGAAAAGTPGLADSVQICNLGAAHTVTVSTNASAASLAINQGNQNSTLAINGGVTLNITGNAIATGNTNLVNKLISVGANATFAVGGNLALVTGNQTKNAELRLADGATTRVAVGGFFAGTAGGAFNARALITFLGQGTLRVGGNLASGATLAGGTGTIDFNGAAAQTIGLYTTFNNVQISNTAGGVQFTAGTTTIGGALNVTNGTLDIRGVTLNVNGATTVTSALTFTTSTNGIKMFNGAVTVNGTWTNTINESVALGGGLTNNGTFTAGNGAHTLAGALINTGTFNAGTGTFSLSGNFTNDGTFNPSTGQFIFNGGAAQTISGISGATTFGSLEVNNAGGVGVSGTHNLTVNNILTLTNGAVGINSNVLHVANSAVGAITRTNGFVDGNLRWTLPTSGGLLLRTYPVGTGTTYTPVSLTFVSVSTGGDITVRSNAGDHPNVSTSGLDGTLGVNRYWTIVNSGVVFPSYSAVFNWVAGDLDVGADTTVFEAQRYSPPVPAAGVWNSATASAQNPTNIQISGVTAFGDFAVGQPLAAAGGIGRFNAYDTTTAADAVTGFITTRVAGTPFNVDIIAIRNHRKSIDTGFAGTVRVELLNSSDSSGTLDAATGCNSSWALIPTVVPDPVFNGTENGRKTITITENNSYRQVRLRIRNLPGGTLIGCSTDAFAIRPASFSVSVTDATWDTAGTTRALDNAGGRVHKAGQPFTITITPSPASAANYDGNPTVGSLACTGPTPCTNNGTLSPGAFAGSGVRVSTTAAYSEAGAFSLTLDDRTFAIVDATDGSPADCSAAGRWVCQSGAPVTVGRFVPDRFEFTGPNTPQLVTYGATTCGTRSFTYVGQPFWYVSGMLTPSATLNAVNAAGAVTTNYALDIASSKPAITESYTDATSPVAAPVNTASIGSATLGVGAGTGIYTASLTGQLSYTRSTTTPVAAFNAAIVLTVTASDATDAAVPGNGTINTPTPLLFNGGGTGIAFDVSPSIRYGRLRIGNANGSQLVPLRLPLEIQHFSGGTFVTNAGDTCTTLTATNFELGPYTPNLNACETSVTMGSFIGGRSAVVLSAPGSANNGSVTVTARLETSVAPGPLTCLGGVSTAVSGAGRTYLQGNWTTPTFTQNPSGKATFGVYPGSDEVIFIREVFQ